GTLLALRSYWTRVAAVALVSFGTLRTLGTRLPLGTLRTRLAFVAFGSGLALGTRLSLRSRQPRVAAVALIALIAFVSLVALGDGCIVCPRDPCAGGRVAQSG